MNRSMPSNIIIPVLIYPDIEDAALWLIKTLGFRMRWKAGTHRAQLIFNGSAIAITEGNSIPSFPRMYHSLILRVDDVDAHYKRALNSGANIDNPPADFPYGERQYTIIDIGGHSWTISQSIADVTPESWGGKSYDMN
jgi:uncharacterized glyoxalase superfamily protein PhnB